MPSSFPFAFRALGRARGFTIASVATIALAIGAGSAVFSLVDAVLLRPLPYPHSDRLVGLWHSMPGIGIQAAKQALGTYAIYREDSRSFEEMGLYLSIAATLGYPASDRSPERVRAGWMTASMFSVLGARPLRGRLFTDADARSGAPPVTVISERLWTDRFGRDGAITERTIEVDGMARRIIGVMPESFAFPESRTPLWTPLDASNPTYVGGFGFDGIGRLRPGVTTVAARRELERLLPRLSARFPELRPGVSTALGLRQTQLRPVVTSMRDDVVAGFDRVLWLVGATVALLVIVAFSNVASLLLVRIESRQRVLAVRVALGASPLAIRASVLAESVIIAIIGGVLGLGLATLALRLLVRGAPLGLPRLGEIHLDLTLFLVAAALTVSFVLVGAAVGALRVRSRNVMQTLRDGGRTGTTGRSAQRMRAAFVAAEVALSLVLLAGSGVLGRSVMRLRAVQPGFDPANTFTFWTFLPTTTYPRAADAARFYREAIDRIGRIPDVVAVGTTAKLPLEVEGFPYKVLIWADDGSDASAALPPVFQSASTSSGYFRALRIPLVAGRTYDDANTRRGANEAVVSRAFVDHFWHDPTGRIGVGKRLRPAADGPWFTIVGVAGDVRDSTLTQPPLAQVYFPEDRLGDSAPGVVQTTARDMAFVVRTRAAAPGLPLLLRQELRSLDPNLPFYRPATMEQVVADAHGQMTFALLLLTAGAAVTLLLGVIGLYGVIAYVVRLRSREIGIRIALGLDPAGAARMILWEGERIVAVGTVIGLASFVVFAHLLESLAFEVGALDGAAVAGAAAAVLSIATLATWIPARRAARVNPADALRTD